MILKTSLSLALVVGLVSCSTVPQIPLNIRPDPEEEAPCYMAKFRPKGLHLDPWYSLSFFGRLHAMADSTFPATIQTRCNVGSPR